jgi:hypothetical protein
VLDPDDRGPLLPHRNRVVAAGVGATRIWPSADRANTWSRAPVYMYMLGPITPINVGVAENRLGASATLEGHS